MKDFGISESVGSVKKTSGKKESEGNQIIKYCQKERKKKWKKEMC